VAHWGRHLEYEPAVQDELLAILTMNVPGDQPMREKLRRTRELLHHLVEDMGGTVIATRGSKVGFTVRDGQERKLCKLLVQGDAVFIEYVSGSQKGRVTQVASLSNLLHGRTKRIEKSLIPKVLSGR
jgi:phosphoserine phosphatase